MIDTFQISKTFARSPNQGELEREGWKPLMDKLTGAPTALCLNSKSGEPRLTLSQNRNEYWIIRAEVSLGSWLHDSNLYLPDETELFQGLDLLSEYVERKSGIVFDAHTERVSRVDFTRDFQVGESAVIPIIAKFGKIQLPRYKRICFDDTSVYFRNVAKQRTKDFLIYSKYHERLSKSADKVEIEAAKGLIRLENSFRKSGVARLAQSLKLKSHHANHILLKETSERVIQGAMKRLHFENLMNAEKSNLKSLFELCGATAVFSRIGFLYMKEKFGDDFAELPFVEASPKTLKRYADDCRRAGVMSLE